jgi:hypothetical protein
LQAADQREVAALPDARGLQLQRAEVVEQLGHLADAGQVSPSRTTVLWQ